MFFVQYPGSDPTNSKRKQADNDKSIIRTGKRHAVNVHVHAIQTGNNGRDEQAIAQTAQKFGAYCRKIAMNLLGSQEDAEECENDTWMAAWNSMPQNRPDKLAPYLGRITRNLALDLRERQNAKKRGGGQTETVLEELEFCLPAGDHTAQEVESAETARSISAFLRSQPEQARNIFIRRYWYCDATADIAKRYGIGESKVRVTLHRMRTKLKAYLEKEGVCL